VSLKWVPLYIHIYIYINLRYTVLDKPEDISLADQKVAFAEVKKPFTITLRVRAFPEPTKYELKSSQAPVSTVTGSKQQVANDVDVYVISFNVHVTDYSMYGNYTAVIGNGINGELIIRLFINPRGI
jgi:hypothetical protein